MGVQCLWRHFPCYFWELGFTVLFCWTRYRAFGPVVGHIWLEGGLHAANAVSTVTLTYTLLGIGTLADQDLTPDTVQGVIRALTNHFSLAFMTTVIGLPAAAALRELLLITEAGREPPRLLTGEKQ